MESRAYLDALSNPVLDRLARLVTRLLSVPVSLVTLIEGETVNFPGQSGLTGALAERRGVPFSHALSRFVVRRGAALVVADARQDPQLREHPACTEHGVVAYAGVPLRTLDGTLLGALCAIDHVPRQWTDGEIGILEDLAAAAVSEVELRLTARQLVTAQEALREQGTRDELTGLLNRRSFSERARLQLAQSQRNGAPFTIATIDLDRFRQINEQCGHDVGDEALVEMAAVLTSVCRDVDLLARMNGNEFVVLLTDTAESGAMVFRQRLDRELRVANAMPNRAFPLASSIGCASWTAEAPMSYVTLLRVADEALQADKRSRRGPPAI